MFWNEDYPRLGGNLSTNTGESGQNSFLANVVLLMVAFFWVNLGFLLHWYTSNGIFSKLLGYMRNGPYVYTRCIHVRAKQDYAYFRCLPRIDLCMMLCCILNQSSGEFLHWIIAGAQVSVPAHNIFCVTETWLSDSMFDYEVLPANYIHCTVMTEIPVVVVF